MIDVRGLSKRYGEKVAVDDLTFQVRPGVVTGFLGPNGAGKSTTMRLILGLDAPTSGEASIDGRVYRELPAPLHEVGAMLEAHAIHTGRSAYNHLLALAQTHGIPRSRVEEVIELVGLGEVARKRVGSFSLGMGQRLGVASALLGDPATVILDEPANGLDPEGIHWIRTLLKRLAAEGRTVFLSSHLMSEMAQTAEQLIVVGRGRLIADTSVAEFVRRASSDVSVPRALARAHRARGGAAAGSAPRFAVLGEGLLEVNGLSAAADRRARTGGADRDLRADAAAGLAGAGVHQPHRRVGRVPRRRDRAARARADRSRRRERDAGPAGGREPRRPIFTGGVTQLGVLRSEWTKLWSLRSTRWSLLFAFVTMAGPRAADRRRDDEPLGTPEPARTRDVRPDQHRARRLSPGAARDRRARRAGDLRRVLDRADPLDVHGRAATPAGALGEGGDVRRRRRSC